MTTDTSQDGPTRTSYGPGTALVVVDVQHDFASPDGGLYVTGGDAVVPVVDAEVRAARDAGATVVYTQDWHPPVTPHFAKDGGVWPVHCVADTWGAELHRDLTVDGPVVRKGVDGGTATPASRCATPSAARRKPPSSDASSSRLTSTASSWSASPVTSV